MKGRVNPGAQTGSTNRSPQRERRVGIPGASARRSDDACTVTHRDVAVPSCALRPTFLSLAICVLLPFAAVTMAQQPGVQLKLEAQTLELGESINVQVVCTNTGPPGTPEASVPAGLDLKLISTTPNSNSSVQIINGRRSQRTTYTFLMRLTGLKVGTYTLGPIDVEADDTTYRTQPVRVVVRAGDTMSTPQGDRFIFAEIDAQPRSLYVTETLTARLTIGIRKVEINGRIFEIDLLRKVLDQGRSQFSVFSDGSVKKTERWLQDSSGTRHRYEVFHVTKQVRAEQIGDNAVGPVFLKANYPTKIRRGFFGGYEVSSTRRETARAKGVTVEVKAPPEQGRPPDYAGAIGRFSMRVTAKPARVDQGQPVTLAISITGSPLEGIAGPDLTRQPELASRFDYAGEELVGDMEGGAKVFRRAIFPKQVGEQTIPPLSWCYFDPRDERYVAVTSDPIRITVDPPTATQTTITLLDETESQPQKISLTVLTGGISPNFIQPGAVLADQSFAFTVPWIASLGLSPFVWLIVSVTTRHRARLRADETFARRRRARREARAGISRALSNGDPARQLHGLAESMTGYLSDRFGLGPGTLTPGEVRTLLTTHGIQESTATAIVDFLQTCDAVLYAPGALGTLSVPQTAAKVAGWIKQIESVRPVANRSQSGDTH